MGILDWILLAPILYGIGKGLWGGAVNEWSGLAGIVLGILALDGSKPTCPIGFKKSLTPALPARKRLLFYSFL